MAKNAQQWRSPSGEVLTLRTFTSLTARHSLSARLLLPGKEMAKVQAVKGMIDGCCQTLPVSPLKWQE